MYVCPTSAHRGFRYGYRRYKDKTFILKTTLFGLQSLILRPDLTLLNIATENLVALLESLESLYLKSKASRMQNTKLA